MTARCLILWGFQGTIDFRAQLDETDFGGLGLSVPQEDGELFVSKAELLELVDRVEALGRPVTKAPGGSPLVSALAATSWFESRGIADSCARFVGVLPDGLSALVPENRHTVLEFAQVRPEICGTLALEHPPTSAKLMLTAPDGRWLDEEVACIALVGIRRAVEDLRPSSVLLGFGGLNKSNPSVAGELVRTIRRTVPEPLVFISGNSFARTPVGAPADFWPDLYRAFSEADILSLSREEWSQLCQRWGDDWAVNLFDDHRTAMVAVHSPEDVKLVAARRLSGHLGRPEDLLARAQERASEYAARALTGLGARFDGVLSALIADEWRSSGALEQS